MNKLIAPIVFVFCCCVVTSCKEKKARRWPQDNKIELTKEERLEISQRSLREAVKKEQEQISRYIKRKGGRFVKNGTGTHYYIYEQKDSGTLAKDQQLATIEYTLTLLKGDTIYHKKTEDFIIAYGEKESGLHECIKHMKSGEKAVIIIPSYRAHGLTGDLEKIPPLTTLVYQISLLNLK